MSNLNEFPVEPSHFQNGDHTNGQNGNQNGSYAQNGAHQNGTYQNGRHAQPDRDPMPATAAPHEEGDAGRRYAQIIGWGYSVPEKVITNHDLEQIVETNDEWIRTRTGD